MDEYPQPRPVLYGTWEDEAPAQTLTLPVRSGPPRYPPAPPMAGDAPEPGEPNRNRYVSSGPLYEVRSDGRKKVILVLLYAAYLVLSLALAVWNVEQFAVLGFVAIVVIVYAVVRKLADWHLQSLYTRLVLHRRSQYSGRISRPDLRGWRNRW
ncbi:MAG: hypothetical protein ABIQ44_01745 [Chloroflexia bacterium]